MDIVKKDVFSVASYSFHGLFKLGAFSIFQYFDVVKYRYHLDTADIWNIMLKSYDEDYLKLVRQQLDDHGLTVVNFCCDGCHLWNDTPEDMAKCDEVAENCLRAAEILGAKTIRIDAGVREGTMTDEQLEFVARKYERYCAKAATFGAKLGPENHWGATTNVVELRKLFDAVKADNFGLLLHLGNWAMSDDKSYEAFLQNDREFAPKAFHMHMMFERCEHAETEFPPLREAGYTGSWGIESHKSTNEYNNVAYQLARAKRVLTPCDY